MPSAPRSLVVVTYRKQGLIAEVDEAVALSGTFKEEQDGFVTLCKIAGCTSKGSNDKLKHNMHDKIEIQQVNPHERKNTKEKLETDVIYMAPVTNETEVSIFLPGSKTLNKILKSATCVECRNDTNFCKSIIYGMPRCTHFCFNFPTDKSTQNASISTRKTPMITKVKNDRCTIQEFQNVSLFDNTLETPYNEGDNLEIQASCKVGFPYISENPMSTATCQGSNSWKVEHHCERCSGKDNCQDRRMKNNSLGNHCDENTGACMCRKDSDCYSKETFGNYEDCQFGEKCSKPVCYPTFNGSKQKIIHEEQKVLINLQHKSCPSKKIRLLKMAVMGGGGGSCGDLGCKGGNSGYLVFRKFDISLVDLEIFQLSITVGKGGRDSGTFSKISGPDWWPHVEAKGGLSGIHCKGADCGAPSQVTYAYNGTFATGGNTGNSGRKLEVTIPLSGPYLRTIDGQSDPEIGGGGTGLIVYSDDGNVAQPEFGFGSGGGGGNPGNNGVLVIWSETYDKTPKLICANIALKLHIKCDPNGTSDCDYQQIDDITDCVDLF